MDRAPSKASPKAKSPRKLFNKRTKPRKPKESPKNRKNAPSKNAPSTSVSGSTKSKAPPARTENSIRDIAEGACSSFEEPLNLSVQSQLLSQLSHDPGASTQSLDADPDKSSGSITLTAQQLREHRLKFQRQRALKSMGKYNTKLNSQRHAERKFYYDLQTNVSSSSSGPVLALSTCFHAKSRFLQACDVS